MQSKYYRDKEEDEEGAKISFKNAENYIFISLEFKCLYKKAEICARQKWYGSKILIKLGGWFFFKYPKAGLFSENYAQLQNINRWSGFSTTK